MEKLEPDSIQAFDALYTTNQIQVLKLLLPFCSPQTQRSLAILIRLLELNYTIGFVRSHPEAFHDPSDSLSFPDLCVKIRGFCPPQLQAMLDQLMSFQNAMQMYEQIKPLLELFAEQGTDSGSPRDTDGGSSQDTDSGSQQGARIPFRIWRSCWRECSPLPRGSCFRCFRRASRRQKTPEARTEKKIKRRMLHGRTGRKTPLDDGAVASGHPAGKAGFFTENGI